MTNNKDISRRNILSTAIAGSLAAFGFDEAWANCVPDNRQNLRAVKDLIAYRNLEGISKYWSAGCNNPGYRFLPRGMLYFDKDKSGKDVLVAESGFVINYHPRNTENKVDQWVTYSKAVYSKNKNEGFKVSFYNDKSKLIKTITQAQVCNPHTKDKIFSYSHPSNSGRVGIEDEHRFRKRSLSDRPAAAPTLDQETVRSRMSAIATDMIHEFFGNLRRLDRFRYAGVIASQGDGWTPAYYAPRPHEATRPGINRIEMITLNWTPIVGNSPTDLITGTFFISSASVSARTASQQLREHQGSHRYIYEFVAVRQGDIIGNTHNYRIFVNVVRFRQSPRNRQVTLSVTPFISNQAGLTAISNTFLAPAYNNWDRYGDLVQDLSAAVSRYRRALDRENEEIRESMANALVAPQNNIPDLRGQFTAPPGAGQGNQAENDARFDPEYAAAWPGMALLCLGIEIQQRVGALPQFQRNQVNPLNPPIIPANELLEASQAYISALRELNQFITDRVQGVNPAGIAGRNISWPFATLGFRDQNAEHRRLIGYTHDVVKEKTKPAPKNDPKYGDFITVVPGIVCRVCPDKDDWYDVDAVKT
jgi:hypothetical protein